jgi:urease accessory protein
MDDDGIGLITAAGDPALNNPLVKRWEARLDLDFKQSNGRSYLAKNWHQGPLVLQKSLHPEGDAVCHGVVIHPPGGVAGGDELNINIHVNNDANALLTTPGAGKWYKANGYFARQHLLFNVDQNACLEWFPQENILFDGSQVKFLGTVNLGKNAKFASWEILCFGRQAQNEKWQYGQLHQSLSIRRENKLIWNERSVLTPSSLCMTSMVGMNSNLVSGGFVVAAGSVPANIIEACRAIKLDSMLDSYAQYGVTALPEVFSARYIGFSSQTARAYFEQLWQILRPWYTGFDAKRPRIWNT